jgi:hypothetical protein
MCHRYAPAVALLCLAAVARTVYAADADGFSDRFQADPANLSPTGRANFLVLEPGYQLVLEGTSAHGHAVRRVVTVLDRTRKIDGVEARTVESFETVNNKPSRITRSYYAIDKTTNDTYAFGQDVDEYRNDKLAGHPGAWRAGKDDARYALFLPARPQPGQKFHQSVAPKSSLDRAEVVATDQPLSTPAGEFPRCVAVRQTSGLRPDAVVQKFYAPGVGLVADGDLKLVKYGTNIEPRPTPPAAAVARNPKPAPVAPVARQALASVGADPDAEAVWAATINDPSVPPEERKDLIEDLNEDGFADPAHVGPDELPLVLSRLAMIEEMAPDAMDRTNADAFAEAYKDLAHIADRLLQQ